MRAAYGLAGASFYAVMQIMTLSFLDRSLKTALYLFMLSIPINLFTAMAGETSPAKPKQIMPFHIAGILTATVGFLAIAYHFSTGTLIASVVGTLIGVVIAVTST